ncbi:MAG: single-stranded-DNA-specific exonuclease RecJ [Bacteroidota bacterium]|nr:single-stranded-DNA-specific exonuclease RecJ [Bacteroidota bacterium]
MNTTESLTIEMNAAELYERPQNRWRGKPRPPAAAVKDLAQLLNGNEIVATLLLQRGISTFDDAKKFFRPSLDDLHDPFLMKDMDKAVARVEDAISKGEKILVYGDYDVDGTTAVALFYTYLKSLDAECGFYIPDRYAEGYGISFMGIDFAKQENYSLIVALDCGIKANDKVAYAKEKGIDFIICDHHRPGDKLPDAVAVLDPKRDDCFYPYDELCGCGIGFKLAQAIAQKRNIPVSELENLLDLVAVAIAADIVPLTGENRVLATFGMKRINENPRPGFKAMLEMAKLKRSISISDVVFIFAPRINAAGRIEHGKLAVELLTSLDEETAKAAAEVVNKNNTDRRDLDKAITSHAMEIMATSVVMQTRKSTVVFDAGWHKGVVGIVASRLIEKYYRPTIVLTESNGKVTGSARSVKDFDVYEAIEACSELLIQFGGHKYAAGLTMDPGKVEAFVQKFEIEVCARITEEQMIPEIEIDMEIPFEQIDWKFFAVLKQFAPFGPGNMSPVFLSRRICDRGWARVVGERHLKMDLINPSNPDRIFPAIAFGMGNMLSTLANKNEVDVCYTVEENEYNGKVSLQLGVKDMRA